MQPPAAVVEIAEEPIAASGSGLHTPVIATDAGPAPPARLDPLRPPTSDDLLLAPFEPDVVAGLPTLGLTLASAVARKLGHSRYVPLGTSRKFWYVDDLSVPLSSITTPDQKKRLYVDPRMLPLLRGKRVALIDDVISSGASIVAGLTLMDACGIAPVAIGAAMLQIERWRQPLAELAPHWPERVVGVFQTPMLQRDENGIWRAV